MIVTPHSLKVETILNNRDVSAGRTKCLFQKNRKDNMLSPMTKAADPVEITGFLIIFFNYKLSVGYKTQFFSVSLKILVAGLENDI